MFLHHTKKHQYKLCDIPSWHILQRYHTIALWPSNLIFCMLGRYTYFQNNLAVILLQIWSRKTFFSLAVSWVRNIWFSSSLITLHRPGFFMKVSSLKQLIRLLHLVISNEIEVHFSIFSLRLIKIYVSYLINFVRITKMHIIWNTIKTVKRLI